MGDFVRHFRDLEVYKNALALAAEVHAFSMTLPAEERFAMADQMRRASRSVCQNLAEAWRKRRYKAAFIAKLSDSETEAGEMQCCLDLCKLHQYISDSQYADWDSRYEKVLSQLITMSHHADKGCR